MKAICLNCTLKRSPEPTSTGALAQVLLDALGEQDVASEQIRLADHRIEPGVISEAVVEGDEWPDLRRRLAAEILIVATPTWLGQPSSIAKRALERMDALLSETYPGNDLPIAYNRVAGVVVTGNEDGAHHVITEVAGALIDIGYTVPGQAWTYWNRGPGPGEETWLTTDEREWTTKTARTAAGNLVAVARALQGSGMPTPSTSGS